MNKPVADVSGNSQNKTSLEMKNYPSKAGLLLHEVPPCLQERVGRDPASTAAPSRIVHLFSASTEECLPALSQGCR